MLISELEPRRVFHFFSEISKIPRGSGNIEGIVDYCLRFASERGLKAWRDEAGNVVICKGATKGYEQSPPVILQGHTDMVCEKRPGCGKDMACEGVDLVVDGEYLRAQDTTLGADNGIAVAYILALLDDGGAIAHPPIEALLTTNEEIGLRGAYAFDGSRLKGRRLINMDSEEEGVITVSCAGAVSVRCRIPVSEKATDRGMIAKTLTVSGLLGGHSGMEIYKNRKNAAVVLAKLIYELSGRMDVGVGSFAAGGRLNVIPPFAQSVVCFDAAEEETFDRTLSEFSDALRRDCAQTEPDVSLTAENAALPPRCLDRDGVGTLTAALLLAPNGVLP